jgi:hypothetical protein
MDFDKSLTVNHSDGSYAVVNLQKVCWVYVQKDKGKAEKVVFHFDGQFAVSDPQVAEQVVTELSTTRLVPGH